MEDVSPEKQAEYLAALLKPLCQQLEELLLDAKANGLKETSTKVTTLQLIIVALNALSKGFNERLVTSSRPTIGNMFKQTKDMVEFLVLVNQLMCSFGSSLGSILEEMFPAIASRLFLILSSDLSPSGPGCNTELVPFGEIVLAQKVMYEKFGNDFIIHFVSKGLPAAHCPQNLLEEYCKKLQQANDIKALKTFYQSLIQNLRQQQNGSLVFR